MHKIRSQLELKFKHRGWKVNLLWDKSDPDEGNCNGIMDALGDDAWGAFSWEEWVPELEVRIKLIGDDTLGCAPCVIVMEENCIMEKNYSKDSITCLLWFNWYLILENKRLHEYKKGKSLGKINFQQNIYC